MRSRDIEDIERFYGERRQELFSYALMHAGRAPEAEDLVHQVFARLLQLPRLPDNLPAYVFRAIRNAGVDLHRHNGHATRYAALFEREPVLSNNRVMLYEEAEHLLAILNADERECVVMKLFTGLTFAEIAEVRGVPINTAASWYRRALEKMRAYAEKES